jgi:hypothetical protein
MIRTSPEHIRKTTVFTCMSAWRKLERSNCKLEERFENARVKRMQAEETAKSVPCGLVASPPWPVTVRRWLFFGSLAMKVPFICVKKKEKKTANAPALVAETALPRSMHSVHDVQCFANF